MERHLGRCQEGLLRLWKLSHGHGHGTRMWMRMHEPQKGNYSTTVVVHCCAVRCKDGAHVEQITYPHLMIDSRYFMEYMYQA